jgi:hypothetical protein
MVLKAHELEVQHIQFGKLEDNSLVQSQKLAFISYKEPKARLVVQTPEFLTETYGIPARAPSTLPPRPEPSSSSPSATRGTCTRGRWTTLRLSSFTRSSRRSTNTATRTNSERTCSERSLPRSTSISHWSEPPKKDPENPRDETKTYYRPPYTKVKLDLFHDTEKPNFRLFDKSSGQRQEVPLTSFNDVLQHMRFMSKHRMVIHFSKLYAMKTSSGSDKRKYGIVLKATAVECVR